MEAQEIFNLVVQHLRRQGAPSMVNSTCSYRGPEGRSCAVGCLITDEEYHPGMEWKNVYTLAENDLLPERLKGHLALLEALQVIHDRFDPGEWNDELSELAEKKGLQMPKLD